MFLIVVAFDVEKCETSWLNFAEKRRQNGVPLDYKSTSLASTSLAETPSPSSPSALLLLLLLTCFVKHRVKRGHFRSVKI